MITFEQIEQANAKLTGMDINGKNYIQVPQRVKAFRMLLPEGFITTDIVAHDGTTMLMKSEVGFYADDGRRVVLGTGFAQEEKGKGLVNGTSYVENCETSAVGRALGFLSFGIDGGGICSAEELTNALIAQGQNEKQKPKQDKQENPKVVVTVAKKVPETVSRVFANEMTFFGQAFGICDKDAAYKRFAEMRKALIDSGAVDDIPSEKLTVEKTRELFAAIYENFDPEGVLRK